MNYTLTEIILFAAFIITSLVAFKAIGKASANKEMLDEVRNNNKTLYDLYCQNHSSAITLMNTLDKALSYQKELEEKNYKLTLEILQSTFQPK